jgi:hypothetical protein
MHDTIFVGMDAHKATISIADADGARGAEVCRSTIFFRRPLEFRRVDVPSGAYLDRWKHRALRSEKRGRNFAGCLT